METTFSLEFYGTFVHIMHPPGLAATAESVADIWGRLVDDCDKRNCRKVLVEASNMEGWLDTVSAFESGRLLAKIEPGIKVALCFYNYKFDELSSFFKTVAENRGVRVEFFSNPDEAKKWLDVNTLPA